MPWIANYTPTNDVKNLASQASQLTGLSPIVILSQWYAEEGSNALNTSAWGNFYNNPAGIRPGNSAADQLAMVSPSGNLALSPGGFLEFPSPQAGTQAYADVMNQSNFASVRNAASSGQFDYVANGQNIDYSGTAAQIMAIAASPWDAGHYEGNSGVVGSSLVSAYDAVSQSTLPIQLPNPVTKSTYKPLLGSNLRKTFSNWDSSFQFSNFSISSMWNGSFFTQNGAALFLRTVFALLGILLIAFAVFQFLSTQKQNIAQIASGIAPFIE